MILQGKEFHYVIIIEGHGDLVRSEEIKTLREAEEIAIALGGKVGFREGKWRNIEPANEA